MKQKDYEMYIESLQEQINALERDRDSWKMESIKAIAELGEQKIAKATVEEEKINNITTNMMEHICDKLCKQPQRKINQEELENICSDCEMGKYVCDILNLNQEEVKK